MDSLDDFWRKLLIHEVELQLLGQELAVLDLFLALVLSVVYLGKCLHSMMPNRVM